MVFESCPYQYYLRWIEGYPEGPKPAADRGTRIHEMAEEYVKGKVKLPKELDHFEAEFTALRQRYSLGDVVCEEEWGFDREWQPCDYKKAWLRLKCDVVCRMSPSHVLIVDNKTGMRFGNEIKHAQQLQLYAVCALLRYPKATRTTNELWYVDKNELASFQLQRSKLGWYLSQFDKRGRALTECKEFRANPNPLSCKYCTWAPHREGGCPNGMDASRRAMEKLAPVQFQEKKLKTKKLKTDKLFVNENLERFR
jgi:hypothetical protein